MQQQKCPLKLCKASPVRRWELVWFSTPVRLNLVEVSSGRKVAVLQGNWCLPFMRKKGQWNYKDRITLYEGADDPTWVRIVVGSGMQEADRHRGRRCAASSAGGG